MLDLATMLNVMDCGESNEKYFTANVYSFLYLELK